MKISLNGLSSAIFGVSRKHQDQHADMMRAIDVLANREQCKFHRDCEKTMGTVIRQQTLNTDHIAQHEKRLDKGVEDFKEIKKSIASLDKSYSLLAQKAEQRRETDRKEESDGG